MKDCCKKVSKEECEGNSRNIYIYIYICIFVIHKTLLVM